MFARAPQSALEILFIVWRNVGVFFGSRSFPLLKVRGASGPGSGGNTSWGWSSATIWAGAGSSNGVLALIGVGFLGGLLVLLAIKYSPEFVYCCVRYCIAVFGCRLF